MPVVFVKKPVVKTAEEHQVVQVGGASVDPMPAVMDLHPFGAVTSRPLAVVIAGFDQSSQPAGNRPTVPTHPHHDVVLIDGGFDHRVTGETSGGFVGNHRTPGYLGNTTGWVVD